MKTLSSKMFDHLKWVRDTKPILPDGIYYFDAPPYDWLSNFFEHPIVYRGQVWATTEAAYQAGKTDDREHRERIRQAPTPSEAKWLGQATQFVRHRVKMRTDWETIKYDVMIDLLRLKFADPGLREKLLSTGDLKLVEGNHWGDREWGVCDGHGANNLGRSLMLVRAECRVEELLRQRAPVPA